MDYMHVKENHQLLISDLLKKSKFAYVNIKFVDILFNKKKLFQKMQEFLYLLICFSWIPNCAKLFVDHNELWEHLVPPDDDDSTELVEEFFACVAALMSIQLRGMVINSLSDFLRFFETHKVRFCSEHLSKLQNTHGNL